MKLSAILLLCSLTLAVEAGVYRCEQGGRIIYTDKACAAGAEPATLPPLTRLPAQPNAEDLAKQFDADEKRKADGLASADRDWLKRHQADQAQAAAVRKALIENRVIKGMTPDQVRRVLSAPDVVDDQGKPNERWTYQQGRERRTIQFKDGVVSRDTMVKPRK